MYECIIITHVCLLLFTLAQIDKFTESGVKDIHMTKLVEFVTIFVYEFMMTSEA